MTFRFPKSARLLKRSQFQRLNHHNRRYVGRKIVIDYRPNNQERESARLGIIVTRRFGKSHERNRFKRLVREVFRHLRKEIRAGIDFVVKPKDGAHAESVSEIKEDFLEWVSFLKT